MKIAVSSLSNIRENDGFSLRVKAIFKVLKAHYNVYLIIRGDNEDEKKFKNTIIVKPKNTKFWNLKLIPIIIKNKFDCIYIIGDIFGFLTYYLLSKIYKYKIIYESTGILYEIQKSVHSPSLLVKLYQILEAFAYKHADQVIAVAGYIYEYCKGYNKNVDFVPLFMDEKLFKKNNAIKYNNASSKFIGLIGPFEDSSSRYSLDFLYKNLDEFDDRIIFRVIGRCDYKIEAERVIYTGYIDSTQDYINQLSSLEGVLVLEGDDPGPYTKVIEAMACSLPVFIGSRLELGLDFLQSGKDIFIFREDEIIEKINDLIFNEEQMKEIGRNAQITFEKYYSRKTQERRLRDILENLK